MSVSGWNIRKRVLVLVAALAVPMNLVVVAALVVLADRERDARLLGLEYTARAIVSAADAQLLALIGIGRVLAASPSLLEDDLSHFRVEAERALPDGRAAWLAVSDVSGQQVLNLLRAPGEALPVRVGMVSHRKALETGDMVISDVLRGPVTKTWLVTLDFPVFRDGKPFRVMSVVINAGIFGDLLVRQHPPANWLTAIVDARGYFIARYPENGNVGQPASAGWRAVMDHNGIERFDALDGERVVNVNEISNLTGWRVGIGVKEAEIVGPAWTTIGVSVVASALVSVASLLLALWLARTIAHPVAELEQKAAALVSGRQVTLIASLPEVNRVWQALTAAMIQRTRAERHGKLLTNELAHRVKNTLAVVQALAMQTLRADPDPRHFADLFSARLASLARAHDLLTGHSWTSASLEEVLRTAVEPFRLRGTQDRFTIQGPPVMVMANPAITLTLMLHELATNAAKYGSLSAPGGIVAVTWTHAEEPSGASVHFTWSESGGPTVHAPDHKGFGSRLLQTGALQLGGSIELTWRGEGLLCCLTFPLRRDSDQSRSQA